jgi:hypothetical protein
MYKTIIQTLLAGFYAILAASPLEGGGVMIAARQIAFGSGKRGLSAKDYVQDGLIAMWDGIENAGWGVHDPNATEWVNLGSIGSSGNLIPNVGFSFESNHIKCDGSNVNTWAARSAGPTFGIYDTIWIDTKGVEAVFAIDGLPTTHSFVFWSGGTYVWSQSGKTQLRYCNQCSYPAAAFPSQLSDIYSASWTNSRLAVNGEILTPSSGGGGASNSYIYIGYGPGNTTDARFNGRIYSLRVYDRFLTSDEQLANYAVDKARFNLP